MSDTFAANSLQGLASGHLIGGAIQTPYGNPGHVSFQRSDGPAQVAISTALSPVAAMQLDEFLRKLIAEDAPVLAAMHEKLRVDAERQQRDAYARAMAQAQNNIASQTRFDQ